MVDGVDRAAKKQESQTRALTAVSRCGLGLGLAVRRGGDEEDAPRLRLKYEFSPVNDGVAEETGGVGQRSDEREE